MLQLQRKEKTLAKQVQSLQSILEKTKAKHEQAKADIIKLQAQQDAALAREHDAEIRLQQQQQQHGQAKPAVSPSQAPRHKVLT